MKQAFIKRCSFLLFTLMSIIAAAQNSNGQVTVTGLVTDNAGIPMSGVNVTEKSSKNTTSTDFSGHYKIKVNKGATLVFSFIGMKKMEIPLGGRTSIDIKMQDDSNQLENVVVVGYGTQKKKNLTGAIATIKPSDLQDLPTTNLSDALKGLVPGMTVVGGSGRPGDPSSVQIRQTFYFGKDAGSSLPLVVIDDMVQIDPASGLPTMDTFNRLDPSEIESLSILKDASAAIYGSRAAQGAIVVKTKRGKSGKARFNYNSQFAVNDAVSHTKTMNAYESGVFNNRFLLSQNPTTAAASLFSTAELEEMKSLDYDWLKKAWKTATQQKHTFGVSGGSEDITYFAGATYLTQDANLGDQKYNKWNFRTGINAKLTSDLDFSASISGNSGNIEKSFTKATSGINDSSYGSLTKGSGEQADYGYLVHMPKYIPWETTVNGVNYYMSPFPRTDRNLGSANANNTIAGWNYFATLNNGSKQTSDDFSYNVNASLTYKIAAVKGLSLKGSYSRNQFSSYTEQIALPYDLARITNYNTQDNHLASGATNADYLVETNVRSSRVYYTNNDSKSSQVNFFTNYERTFGDHEVGGMLGVEGSEAYSTGTRLAYENTPKDYQGDYRTAGTITTNSTSTKVESGTLSYLGRFNYGYQGKYLASFLFRSDASTKFSPDNYWGFFPSLQLGWIMSKEKWFENSLPWVNFLKLRYSIGKTGKDNIQYWRWIQYYDVIADKGFVFGTGTNASGGGALGGAVTPKVTPNEDLRWDSTVKNNIGLDFNVLNNRLQVAADFYYDKTTDMLTDMSSATGVPISVGGGFAEQNYSNINAWGAELGVNWSDRIKDKFSYNVGVNFGYSDNEVKKYPEQAVNYPSIMSTTTRMGNSIGFGPVWGFQTWKGTSTGDGILRTDADIANYWQYLTDHAAAAGAGNGTGQPNYMGINAMSGMRKGMLAYEDVAGQLNTNNGTMAGPDGQIVKDNDYVKLAKSARVYGVTTNLGMKYEGFYLRAQIATSWGGARFVDLVSQGTASAHNMWAHETFWNDMYGDDNPNGKYPNLAQYSYISAPSDFWQLDTFRCFVRNLTVGFDIPKQAYANTKLQAISLGITGNNLWDIYNPYPNHYRNMYDSSYENYPTLRTWSLNLNVSF
ncbi:SusC/RagA family TonB-linked outer membrane protein [Flavobacterium aquiphilum]|uniref:SusC/RagA family TonB-linked outer membrane protein n=1 Tax=Flavobacterium aquiphilum TaxID=3003261 RepID=UPI0024802197|nr:SusC/RagA family TonB-linked outer membrane protein [Flavobacterium aquiphilum]